MTFRNCAFISSSCLQLLVWEHAANRIMIREEATLVHVNAFDSTASSLVSVLEYSCYPKNTNDQTASGCKYLYFCCNVLMWQPVGTDSLLEPPVDVRGTAAFLIFVHTHFEASCFSCWPEVQFQFALFLQFIKKHNTVCMC